MYLEEKVGDEDVETIVWYDMTTDLQVSTQVADIERIIAKPKQQRNGKWIGLGIGGVIDAILLNSLTFF